MLLLCFRKKNFAKEHLFATKLNCISMFATFYRSVVLGILVEKGSSTPDYQATSPCPGTLSEGRANKLQGNALWYIANTGMPTFCQVLLPCKKQIIGFEFRPRCKITLLKALTRKQATKKKKKSKSRVNYTILCTENDTSTPQNFCISTPQII